jgi:hypothetical protein
MLKQLLVISLLVVLASSAAQGALVFESTEADLGFVYRDEPQKLVFEFENTADETVFIVEIEPSCDCTTAQAVPEAVAPRSSGKILVFFDPMGYEGRGPFQEYVRVTSTDLADTEVMLFFSAEVAIGPEPEPRSLAFGKVCRGETDTLGLSIHPAPKRGLMVLDAYSDTTCILVEPAGRSADGAHDFRVIATNRKGCGRVAGFVTVETSDTLRSRLRIPVTVSMVGRIIAEPDILAFGPTLPGAVVAQTVRIYSKDGVKFSVPTVTSSIDHIEPVITPLTADSCELKLRIREDAPPGRIGGSITIETDCPEEPALEIEVAGFVRSSKQ